MRDGKLALHIKPRSRALSRKKKMADKPSGDDHGKDKTNGLQRRLKIRDLEDVKRGHRFEI